MRCGEQEAWAKMSTSDTAPCPVCDRERPKAISLPNFQEDRVRFFKGALGNGYSTALGEQMPDSRQARDRRAREKGIEFISLAEHLSENKEAAEAVEYRKHVNEGGARDEPVQPTSSPFVPRPAWAEALGV